MTKQPVKVPSSSVCVLPDFKETAESQNLRISLFQRDPQESLSPTPQSSRYYFKNNAKYRENNDITSLQATVNCLILVEHDDFKKVPWPW